MKDERDESRVRGFEVRDIHVRHTALSGFTLIVLLCVSLMSIWVIVYLIKLGTPEASSPDVAEGSFPAPMLQTETAADFDAMRAREDAILNGYRWIDRDSGIVSIPIERAMELTAQQAAGIQGEVP